MSEFEVNKKVITDPNKKKSKFWKIRHPTVFQGNLSSKIYFEGWYYKLCSADNKSIYAIIPGIALNKKTKTSHSFIQILDGKTADYTYIRYPIENFSSSQKPHRIEIGQNLFSETMIDLNLKDQNEMSIQGKLEFEETTPLPYKKFSPGVMGPLSFLPFMQTYHGIVSMNHTIQGSLIINGNTVNFNKGKGYIEKDWGKAFPSEWIWMQSNHFNEEQRSFVFSVAKIPYLGMKFKGFFAFLWDRGKFYKFTTYNGSKLRIKDVTGSEVSLQISNKRMGLSIDINAKKTERSNNDLTAIMKTPVKGEMINKTAETMSANIEIHVHHINLKTHKRNRNRFDAFQDIGKLSGLEIMADRRFL